MYIYNKPHGESQSALSPDNNAQGSPDALSPEQPSGHSSSALPSSSTAPPVSAPAPSLSSSHNKDKKLDIQVESKREPEVPSSSSKLGRTVLPFTFPPIYFQQGSNISSVSLAPSTAEGKPVRPDNTTALQKLNSTYPSTSRKGDGKGGRGGSPSYARSTGAQSSTYSQPVLVRTYSGSVAPRYRTSSSSREVSRRVPLPPSSAPGTGIGVDLFGNRRRSNSYSNKKSAARGSNSNSNTDHGSSNSSSAGSNGRTAKGIISMPEQMKTKRSGGGGKSSKLALPLPWQWRSSDSDNNRRKPKKLPPVEAFSFKSFMADMQAQGGDSDIGADLDRIAEICARSRYSLSNQYEVHMAPHGSGASFISGGGVGVNSGPSNKRKGQGHGPTLQAINPDDEESVAGRSSHRGGSSRRKGGGGGGGNAARRRSVAYGTLETIMSSSRSSEEEKTKKKSAAEIAEEVRGRAAARRQWGASGSGENGSRSNGETTTTTDTTADTTATRDGEGSRTSGNGGKLARKKSSSFATAVIMDSSRSSASGGGGSSNKNARSHQRHHQRASSEGGGGGVTPSALVSDPALPQTSESMLGVRTTAGPFNAETSYHAEDQLSGGAARHQTPNHHHYPRGSSGSLLATGSSSNSSWNSWIPWRATAASSTVSRGGRGEAGTHDPHHHHNRGTTTTATSRQGGSRAEGSLRQALRSLEGNAAPQSTTTTTAGSRVGGRTKSASGGYGW